MILSPKDKIDAYTERGWWGTATLDELLRRIVLAHPDRMAVADAPNRKVVTDGTPRRLRYAELDVLIDAYADRLLDVGVGRDDIVLIQMPNVVETLVLLLACGRIGAVASPVAVQYREHELGYILEKLKPKAVATVTRCGEVRMADLMAAAMKNIGCNARLLVWGETIPDGALSMNEVVSCDRASARVATHLAGERPDANDIFTICWTSGTESKPKGVPRSHNHWIAIGKVVATAAAMKDGEVLLGPFPMINMAAIGGVLVPWLLSAGTMVLHHPFDVAVFLDQVQSERVNFNLLPPPILNMLIRQKELLAKFDLSSLRVVCSGSAPLAPWMVSGWQNDYGISIINYFGSNEGVALASSAVDVPDPVERASYFPRFGVDGLGWAAGDPISFETRLRDTVSGEIITTPGREGELCIRGATVFEGYFNAPEMTQAAFDDDGFFRTGDLFVIAGDGPMPRYYQFVGRCKEIIIRGGQNISPAEVDNLIASHPAVAEAACVGLPDEAMGERLCAVVVVRPGAQLTLEDLVAYLREQQVAIYKWPEQLLIVQQLPRNPVGKVIRGDLRGVALEALGR
jgi:acyl-CoA synthetase (AMP-forming)/AMP-acid ligase II